MNTYDIMFIFPSTLVDEAFDKQFEAAQAEITKLGGTVVRSERMGRRSFARPINKRGDGLYGRVWVKLDAVHVDGLVGRYNLNEEILRVQVRKLDGDVPPVAPPRPVMASEGSHYGEPQ